jgi:predicted alpha/beta-hydrolase family hydrolase
VVKPLGLVVLKGDLSSQGLILFHGAGGDRDHHLFVALEDGLGIPVARVNFPYRAKGPGRRPPDRMPKLLAAVAEASATWSGTWGVERERIVLGGRSMGGRAASLAVAGGLPAAGLVLCSYPLHPPGQPDVLRTDHFDQIEVPALVVQGRRDPFGNDGELGAHLEAIPGPVTVHWVKGGHDPGPAQDPEIVETVGTWLTSI